MMRVLILLCMACCVLAGDPFMEISMEICNFITELTNFQNEMNDNIAKATQVRQEVIELTGHLSRLDGSGCDDRYQFQCGGDVPKCISRLLVCDGTSDCPNSMEESQCRIFTPVGSRWKATFTWDSCTNLKSKEMEMVVNSYVIPNQLRSFPEITADMSMTEQVDEFSYSSIFKLKGVMDLLPGAHVLYFRPLESNGLALQCTFDGVNDDHCHGEILYVVSQETCAEFYMERID